ncbi:MAG: GntR family transcriptional regulator [Planctomycetota bacterium]
MARNGDIYQALQGNTSRSSESFSIQKDAYMPRYVQLKRILKSAIIKRNMLQGEPFMSEGELIEQFGLSSTTVRRALKDLVAEGLIYREKGKGTFVGKQMVARTIGFASCTLEEEYSLETHPVFSKEVFAAIKYLQNSLVRTQIIMSRSESKPQGSDIIVQSARHLDGIILLETENAEELDKLAQHYTLPVVHVIAYPPEESIPSVIVDFEEAIYKATKYFIDLGCRHIVFMNNPRSFDFRSDKEKLAGYRRALHEAEIAFDDRLIFDSLHEREKAYEQALVMMKNVPDVQAVVCGSDIIAAGVLQALQSIGVSIPQQVQVTGCGDIEIATATTPQLSTLQIPYDAIGKTAAKMIMSLINGEELTPKSVSFVPQLVERGSTKKRI